MAKDEPNNTLEEKTVNEMPAAAPQEKTIEELAAMLKTPAWAFAGLKVRQNWAAGKMVTEEEFRRALNEFLAGPPVRKG